MRVSSKTPTHYKNTPIVDYLAARFNYVSRQVWLDRILSGDVYLNGEIATPKLLVRQGDTVACQIPDFTPPEINLNYAILYQDDWLLAVNKPPNLRVHGDGKWTTANLIYHVRHQHSPPYPEAALINRLDADSSGVVLLARDAETLRLMSRQFQERRVEKRYLALVHGVPLPASSVIDAPIGKSASSAIKVRQTTVDPVKPKPAITHYETTQHWDDSYALLTIRPETGRTHQIRVHLASIGCPIVGDALYNLSDEQFEAHCQDKSRYQMLMNRQALHSASVQFRHPHLHKSLLIEAAMPADMAATIDKLDKQFSHET